MTAPTTTITPRIGTTVIDGATVEAWTDGSGKPYCVFQERAGNLLKWWVSYRDTHYDGWTGETVWALSAIEATREAKLSESSLVYPDISREPKGWSPSQIGRATVWAGDISDPIRQIALKYARAS